jgi:ATP-binding cassette, subfamily B, bacterial
VIATLRRAMHLAAFRGRYFYGGSAVWVAYFVYPIVPGLLIARAFTAIQHGGSALRLAVLLGTIALVEVVVRVSLRIAHTYFIKGYIAANGLAQTNVVRAQLSSGGTEHARRSISVGDAMTRLRDDPDDLVRFVDNWVDLLGSSIFAVIAVAILARTHALATAVALVPLVLVVFANRAIGHRVRRYRRVSRQATSTVSSFLSAVLGASLTVKLAGAQPGVLGRLDELNGERARAMVRDQVWAEGLYTVNGAVANVCVGLALVIAARSGVTASEIALFASYAAHLVWFPVRLSGVIVGRRRFEVSAGRLDELLPSPVAGHDPLTRHRSLPVLGGPPLDPVEPIARVPLVSLEVGGLSVHERGLRDVSLQLTKGSLTIVCGPVGSGKSSLLQAIIGLLAIDAGEVRWNGALVVDRAAFFVPPQSAYVAQVPSLFAESIASNIALGIDVDERRLRDALRLAAFDVDVAAFPNGLDTLIGSRGVRLSGGQAQRLAAARALVHRPELLLIDDLSSALDVETEIRLWDEVAAAGLTVLAVSNRPTALRRADQIIEL